MQRLTESFPWLEIIYFGNSLLRYSAALLLFFFLLIGLFVMRKRLLKRLYTLSKQTSSSLDDGIINAIKQIPSLYYWFVSLYLPWMILSTPSWISLYVTHIFVILSIIILMRAIHFFVQYVLQQARISSNTSINETNYNFLRLAASLWFWVIVILLIIAQLWFEIWPLLASLGIGWIAIAFALQSTLKDLFASLSIYSDKPFSIGDTIKIDDDVGKVIKVGLKTTRILTLSGEELVYPNGSITSQELRNFGRLEQRRKVISLWVAYETPHEKLVALPEQIQALFAPQTDVVEFNRAHLSDMGDSAIMFTIVYTILDSDFMLAMDIHQDILLSLLKLCADQHIDIAYPTQTLHVKQST